MPNVPLEFPQGVRARGTTYSEGPRVVAANLIRWRGTNIVPVKGWQSIVPLIPDGEAAGDPATIEGTVRSLFSWVDHQGTRWIAIGTTQKVYAYDGTNLYEIQPADWVASPDYPVVLAGYGTGLYSTGEYSTAIGDEVDEGGPGGSYDYGYVSFANWGENLLFCSVADGRLIEWVPTTPLTLGAVVAGAPTRIRALAVTRERHVVVTGAYDTVELPLRASWSSQEDNTDWTPSATNTAGDLDVSSQSFPIRCVSFRDETLIFTSTSLHRMRYVGPPFVYSIETVATDCGLLCPQSVAQSASTLFWLSARGFFTYDGNQVRPVLNEMSDRFRTTDLGDISFATVAVGHNEQAEEFWCFFPTTPGNPTRYIAWNYTENWWTEGEVARTAWVENFAGKAPVAAGFSGETPVLFRHESGWAYTGAPLPSFSTGPIELGQGERFVTVQRFIADFEVGAGDGVPELQALLLTLKFRKFPQGPVLKEVGPVRIGNTYEDSGDGPVQVEARTDLRGSGRTVELSFALDSALGSVQYSDWTLGKCRLEVQPGEGR